MSAKASFQKVWVTKHAKSSRCIVINIPRHLWRQTAFGVFAASVRCTWRALHVSLPELLSLH
jgi:hypothetical protein